MGRNWQRHLRGNPPVLKKLANDFSDVEFSVMRLLVDRDQLVFEFDLELCSYLNHLVAGYLIEDKYKFEDDILKPHITSRGEYFVNSYVPEDQEISNIVLDNLIEENETQET